MAERLFQIGIKGLVINDDSKILLLSMDDGKGGVRWDIPGGRMDSGETFLQTLNRELIEEVGCSYLGAPEIFDTTLSKISIPVGDQEAGLVLITYKVQLSNPENLQIGAEETGYKWFEPEEAAELLSNKYPKEFTAKIKAF